MRCHLESPPVHMSRSKNCCQRMASRIAKHFGAANGFTFSFPTFRHPVALYHLIARAACIAALSTSIGLGEDHTVARGHRVDVVLTVGVFHFLRVFFYARIKDKLLGPKWGARTGT